MPIVVNHTPVYAIAEKAMGVGDYNAGRLNAADARANDAQQLDRDRFAQSIKEAAEQRAFTQAENDRRFYQTQQLQRDNQSADLVQQALHQQNSLQDMLLQDALGSSRQDDQQQFQMDLLGQQGQQRQDLARTQADLTGQNQLAVQDARGQDQIAVQQLKNAPKLLEAQERDQTIQYVDQNTGPGKAFDPSTAAKLTARLMSGAPAPAAYQTMDDYLAKLNSETAAKSFLQDQRDKSAGERQKTSIDATNQRFQQSQDARGARAKDAADRQAMLDEARLQGELAKYKRDDVAAQVSAQRARLSDLRGRKDLDPATQQKLIDSTVQNLSHLLEQQAGVNDEAEAYAQKYLKMVQDHRATTQPAPELPTQSGSQDPAQAQRNASRQAPPQSLTGPGGATLYFTGQYDADGEPLYSE